MSELKLSLENSFLHNHTTNCGTKLIVPIQKGRHVHLSSKPVAVLTVFEHELHWMHMDQKRTCRPRLRFLSLFVGLNSVSVYWRTQRGGLWVQPLPPLHLWDFLIVCLQKILPKLTCSYSLIPKFNTGDVKNCTQFHVLLTSPLPLDTTGRLLYPGL